MSQQRVFSEALKTINWEFVFLELEPFMDLDGNGKISWPKCYLFYYGKWYHYASSIYEKS